MNVKELKQILEELPDGMEIIVHISDADFPSKPVDKAEVKNVRFCEDPEDMDKEPFADEECLIIYPEQY